jgi:hypothetical protein
MKRILILLALLGLIWSAPAAAQSAKSVLEEAGFVGTWAPQCEDEPALGNGHQVFEIQSSGFAQVRVRFGKGYENLIYVIREIRRLPGDQIWIRTRFKSEERELIMLREGNRLRTMSNRRADGTFVVKDGILVTNGGETPWITRCR